MDIFLNRPFIFPTTSLFSCSYGITGLYLILGGYFAVTMTDFIQGFIMLIGATVMAGFLVMKAGGPVEAIATIATNYQEHVPLAKQPSALIVGSLIS